MASHPQKCVERAALKQPHGGFHDVRTVEDRNRVVLRRRHVDKPSCDCWGGKPEGGRSTAKVLRSLDSLREELGKAREQLERLELELQALREELAGEPVFPPEREPGPIAEVPSGPKESESDAGTTPRVFPVRDPNFGSGAERRCRRWGNSFAHGARLGVNTCWWFRGEGDRMWRLRRKRAGQCRSRCRMTRRFGIR